ncbi:MAG: TOBE domain-containing protein, partial [Candidatus Dormibacteraeota bacterium]|nr:TOBE domain-containing protein [Candidatus Dormibacteraeota bacterium]
IQNVFEGQVTAPGRIRSRDLVLAIGGGTPAPGTAVTWGIRPEAIRISPDGVAARVVDRIDLGAMTELELDLSGLRCFARVPGAQAPSVGERCAVVLDPEAIAVWPVGSLGSDRPLPVSREAVAETVPNT